MIFDKSQGIYIQDGPFEIFFGNKNFSTFVEAQAASPLRLLKQVHGGTITVASSVVHEADGHWSSQTDELLAIKTADCLPILISSKDLPVVAALHAGWRGVEQKITTHLFRLCSLANDRSLKIYIGPHIQQKSFEVDEDVAQRLLSSHSISLEHALRDSICFVKGTKFFVNLSELVVRECLSFGIQRSQIWISDIDTKTSSDFYSYRRGDTGVRNYSVIVRRSPF